MGEGKGCGTAHSPPPTSNPPPPLLPLPQAFKDKFKERTGNTWENKEKGLFKKRVGKYDLVDLSEDLDGPTEEELAASLQLSRKVAASSAPKSGEGAGAAIDLSQTLAPPVHDLIVR